MTYLDGRTSAIVGVYSHSFDTRYCGERPGIYTSLPAYRKFLTTAMR
jgi:hypothetical protein